MIFKTLEFLRANVNRFIQLENPLGNGQPSTADFVTLGEVSLADGPHDNYAKNKLLLSLVYSQEELALKNSAPYLARDSSFEVENPPVYLNLGVIFCANFPNDYTNALIRISEVVKFFQSKRYFSFASSPVSETRPFILTPEERNNIEVSVEIMQMSLEEINHLWGILRVRVMPHVMYKVRVVKLKADRKIKGGGKIQQTQTTFE